MKNRFDVFAREIVAGAAENIEPGGAQQFGLAFLEIFKDARVMQTPGGVCVGPANPSGQFD
ncbi:MAG: hypothetical protein JMDDDDMK_04595 [Acidobacteria bacterium]|nr:hypothetical protein [Acidobacteriota bacterium]